MQLEMPVSKSWKTGEVQLPGYDKERYVQVTVQNEVTKKYSTLYLKNISENKNGIVGTEVDKNGSFVKDNLTDVRKHIILKSAILKQQEVRLNQKYGELEVPCQSGTEIIVHAKEETAPQSRSEITERSFNNLIGPINYSNLFIKINSLTLSVRTFNCLINGIGLTYLGELVQKNDYELMHVRNFGRKSLREVKKILSGCGLSLGMTIPDFDTLRYEYEHKQDIDNIEDTPKGDDIDREAFLNLFMKVSELCLSPRSLNCMNNVKIVYVGDLVTKTEAQLFKIKNMGRKSVCEIKSKLSCMGLYLGMELPEWSKKNIEEEIKLLSDELKTHKKNNAQMFLSSIKHADFLEEELIHFVEMFSKEKNIPIIISFLGFDGRGKKTLESTGEEFHITRERVRQITEKFLKNINQSEFVKNTCLPICTNVEKYLANRLPSEADSLEKELVKKGFTKTKFNLEGIFEAITLLEGKQPFFIINIGRKRLVVSSREIKITKKSTKLITQRSKKLISRYGLTNVAEIIDQVFQETGQTLTDKYVISVLSVFKNFSWLDESKGWFWIKSTRRNRIISIIKKILSICENINMHELRAGIGKSYWMGCFIPTTSVLLELCKQIPWCKIECNTVTANPPFKAEDILGTAELKMFKILKAQGSLMATSEFEAACLELGIGRSNFYRNLSYSPILSRYATGVYGLRGANIPPGLVESIAVPKKRETTVSDYGWTKGGNIWIIRKLSPSAVSSAVFDIPKALSPYFQESFTLKSADGVNFGHLEVKNNRVTRLYGFLKRSGCEVGDYLGLTFYLAKKEVIAYIGSDEIRDEFGTPMENVL